MESLLLGVLVAFLLVMGCLLITGMVLTILEMLRDRRR